jgi:hypothetical protein
MIDVHTYACMYTHAHSHAVLTFAVDACQAGDDVGITGVVKMMWTPVTRDTRCEVELFLLGKYRVLTSLLA